MLKRQTCSVSESQGVAVSRVEGSSLSEGRVRQSGSKKSTQSVSSGSKKSTRLQFLVVPAQLHVAETYSSYCR